MVAKGSPPIATADPPRASGLWQTRLPWFRHFAPSALAIEKFNALDIYSPQALILHLPLRYEDRSTITQLSEAQPGQVAQFEVMIRHTTTRGFGRHRQIIAEVTDGSVNASVRFFNLYASQVEALKNGAQLRLYGEMKMSGGVRELIHPRWTLAGRAGELKAELSPVYPLTAGINQAMMTRHINKALDCLPDDILPMLLANDGKLPMLKTALLSLHRPPASVSLATLQSPHYPPRARCKRDELLALQLILRKLRQQSNTHRAIALPEVSAAHDWGQQLIARLPFQLTLAQKKVWREIRADLAQSLPMARLLQGDVGSGKTIIALLACLQALANGHQAAVMAPTEILAEQHYERFCALLKPLGLQVGWLSSSVSKREKEELAGLVAQGLINLVVGTHALIEETIQFRSLAMIVIDEQHRFGVHQRLRFQDRGAGNLRPHQLMMSATPIPRTLAMSHYAHLDVSIIDALPAGRRPIRTRLVNMQRRSAIYDFIRKTIHAGQQVYWICPLIEESEALALQTATQTHARLIADLPEFAPRLALLHGRMAHAERQATMSAFAENRTALLVSTTVIEVGVDVPNATVMVIENAERFGLSQLHQLRGRIGRGAKASVCVLLFQEPLSETARARLKVMFETTDGFAVAAEDLRLRGPGEIIGAAQSGLPPLRFANLSEDLPLLQSARDLAPILLRDYPDIAEQIIDFWMPQAREWESLYLT